MITTLHARIGSVGLLGLALLAPVDASAQICHAPCVGSGDESVGCGVLAKSWTRLSGGRRELVGSLYHLVRYQDPYDNDWNFMLLPDPAFGHLAVRRDNTPNPREAEPGRDVAGLVEGEVHSIFELLDTAFADRRSAPPNGMRVFAKGWWVEDDRHSDKTELHPMTAIIGQRASGTPGQGDDLSILISHDWSDRFCVQDSALVEQVAIPLDTKADSVDVISYAGTSSSAEALVESAILDGDIGSQRSTLSTRQIFQPNGAATLSLQATLLKPKPDAPENYRPLYLGRLQRNRAATFTDQITRTLVSRGPGCQGVAVSVAARFGIPAGLPALSTWEWTFADESPVPGAQFSRVLYYSPCNGESATSWPLRGAASSAGSDFLPPRGGPGEPGRLGFVARTPTRSFVHKARTYEFEPSKVEISWQNSVPPSSPPPTTPLVSVLSSQCGGETKLTAASTVAFRPLLSEQSFKWTITRNSTAYVLDAANRHAQGPDFVADVSASNDHELVISWTTTAAVIAGTSTTLPPPAVGDGTATVLAEFKTLVGESPRKAVVVTRTCWLRGGGKTLGDFMRDLPKVLTAIQKLGLDEFPNPGAPLPPRIRQLGRLDLLRGSSEVVAPGVPARNRLLLRIAEKAQFGKVLSAAETQTLANALTVASQMQANPADVAAALRTRGLVPR